MDESDERIVLCAASAYAQKYYFNPQFSSLPEEVKQELQILCVTYTEDVGGVLEMYFDADGNLEFKTTSEEDDFFYDEIGSALLIKQIQTQKNELLEELQMYFRIVFLGEGWED